MNEMIVQSNSKHHIHTKHSLKMYLLTTTMLINYVQVHHPNFLIKRL